MDPVNSVSDSRLSARLRDLQPQLTRAEARVAQLLLLNEADLPLETGASLAEKAGVSEITVSRFLRRLGYKGIAALKEDLKAAWLEDSFHIRERHLSLLSGDLTSVITKEAEAVVGLAGQLSRPVWGEAMRALGMAGEVYVTGFQTIRGLAEDFARRLAITRSAVRFTSAHDTGLSEWLPPGGGLEGTRLLVLVDIVPYAREAEPLAGLCKRMGVQLIVVTDELNSWAYEHTPYVFHATTKVGSFLESVGPLATLLNLVVHSVAGLDPDGTRRRLDAWPKLLKELDLY